MKYTEYTAEILVKINESYNHQHVITKYDVDMVNEHTKLIESTRSSNIPKVGDRLLFTSKHGDYCPNALIEKKNDDKFSVCVNPYVPFIYSRDEGIRCDVSGGPFTSVPMTDLIYIGQCDSTFCDWGHCGRCGNGAVHFNAKVSVWEYIEPKPLYDGFTTQYWHRVYLNKHKEEEIWRYGNLYTSDKICFAKEEDYQNFLKEHNATVYLGNWPGQFVVWYNKEQRQSSHKGSTIEKPKYR